MPRLPIDYSNTVIYKIVCNDLSITECYVGSTTDFVRRKQRHKNDCLNEKDRKYNYKVYKTIRETGSWENWTMVEIEKYPCKDANEACAKEREWFERLNSTLNTIYPQRGMVEYSKDYKESHRDEILLKGRQYYELHKEEALLKGRQYRETHNEEILIRERIRGRKTYICGCGKLCTCNYKRAHKKTVFHKQYMESVMVASDSTIPIATNEFN